MSRHAFDLSGRLAVVTGARRGIGLAIAAGLARAGADIIGVSAAMPEGESEVRAQVEAAGKAFQPVQLDLRDRDAVASTCERLLAQAVPDILVNNAGTIARAPATEYTAADWDTVLEVNLSSQFTMAQRIGAAMVERRTGKIVFTASLLSYQGGINVAAYTAAKSGLAGLTKALANEWAPHGVNVNALVPGYIATDNTQALQDDTERSAAILGRIPAGRWGQPEDLAGPAVFLCSDAARYMHGSLIAVDGGWLAR